MSKEDTKYKRILTEARERVEEAGSKVEALEKDLAIAEAVFQSLHKGYLALERSLTPAPRKKADKVAASAPAQKEAKAEKKTSGALCVANVPILNVPCGDPEDHLIHSSNGGYGGYHPFEPPKPVARKSRQKKDPSAVIPVDSQGIDGNGLVAEMES